MPPPLRLAFLGIDHPHGAHWRQMLGNFPGEIEIVAFVPSFGGGTASLEERFAELPRYGSVKELLAGATFDAAAVCLSNHDSPAAIVEDSDVRRLVRAEVRKLPEREKLVMSLYYDEGLTLAEIGSVLGVTESRVSQIHTKSVLHLRARLASAGIS